MTEDNDLELSNSEMTRTGTAEGVMNLLVLLQVE